MVNKKKIVIVNQATNYLTIGIANEFARQYKEVVLITGSVHEQGEALDPIIKIDLINKFSEEKLINKLGNWFVSSLWILFLLLFKYRKFEIFFISNPPTAYLNALFLRNKISVLIWDVYPDALKIFGIKETNLIYKSWAKLNQIIFQKSYRVYTIGNNISKLLENYSAPEKIHISHLWTSFNDFNLVPKKENIFLNKLNITEKFIIQYSGNIGITHNVEILLDVAEKLNSYEKILFQIIGRGSRIRDIQEKITMRKIENCMILPFQTDELFPHSLSAVDIGVVILDDKIAQGSVPSKTYNLMIAKKPILYIASKESELMVYSEIYKNGRCFQSTQVNEIVKFIIDVYSDRNLYNQFSRNSLEASKHFTRENAERLVQNYISA